MSVNVAIRADGGPEIGYGHLVRTGALAREFLQHGHAVTYVTDTPEPARSVVPSRAEVVGLDSTVAPGGSDRNALDSLARWIREHRPDILVTDSYRTDTDAQRRLREHGLLFCLVTDDGGTVCADVVVNGNLYAPELDYEWTHPKPVWCLGAQYLLLREEFAARSLDEIPWRDPPEHALVMMGGSDVQNTTPAVIRAFDTIDADLTVDVVVGPGFENEPAIETAARATDTAAVRIHREPENLAQLMQRADVAVSALGSTTYELLATATPTVGLVQADNQQPIGAALRQCDAALVLDSVTTDIESAVGDALQCLVRNSTRRRNLRERARTLVDGKGTRRVYDELISGIDCN